ncbi:hypothetical protein JCM19000A_29110 [Silvimonas sp. JCM 19000]
MTPLESILPLIIHASTTLARLLEVLRGEQDLLVQNRIDGLSALLPEKQQAAALADASARTLQAFLAANGVEGSEAAVRAWLQAHAADALDAWDTLREYARQAAAINRSNGALIDTRRHLIDGFLHDIASERQDDIQVYSERGRMHSGAGTIRRDKA